VAAVGSIEVAPQTGTWNTYFWVDSADETASKVRDAGGSVLMEPFDIKPDAGRKAVCTDREGAAFCVWQARSNKGAQLVNEPGTLVFNGLNTRDIEGAKSFYGRVFGWRTLTLDSGAEMWALPGYGDYLERDNPALRKQLVEMGGAGYRDKVRTTQPSPCPAGSLDDYAPTFDVTDTLVVKVDAEAEAVAAALERLDLTASVTAALSAVGAVDRLALAPALLAAQPGPKLVFGLVSRYGAPSETVEPASVQTFDTPGHVKVIWDLRVQPDALEGAWLSMTRRFAATDEATRARLLDGWGIIGPGC
jgi:predicted enzyme related to lactoylglutathione lyase